MAAPHGSGFMTIPGPPPNGASSTVWCASRAQVRRSCTPNAMTPRWAAFPISETRSAPKYSGKIVMMSMRSVAPASCRLAGILRIQQPRRRVDDQTPRRHVDLGHQRPDERHQDLRAGPVPGAVDHQDILAMVLHVGDHSNLLTGGRNRSQPD